MHVRLNTKTMTGMAMLSALSVVSLAIGIQFPFPFTPSFMLYDVADVFLFLATFMYGPLHGLTVTIIVSAIQAFLMGGSSWAGFIMHVLATGSFCVVSGYIYRWKHDIKGAIIALSCGCLTWMVVIIPANLLTHPLFNGTPLQAVVSMIPAILLFNVIKAVGNSLITLLIYKRMHSFFRYLGVSERIKSDTTNTTTYHTNGASETRRIGEELGKKLKVGDTVLLVGDLGAGKTVFTSGIAKGLGIDSDVLSPTFNILKEYDNGRFCHFDMYRIEDEEELKNLGFEEYFGRDRICVVEWNKIQPIYGTVYNVNIERLDDNMRKITIFKEVRK